MTWKEHLEWLNSETIKELDAKIAEITSEINEKAIESMNKIRWIFKLAKTDKEQLNEISEIENEFHNKSISTIHPWRLKNRKEKYNEDPEAYEKEWNEIQTFVEKLKKKRND